MRCRWKQRGEKCQKRICLFGNKRLVTDQFDEKLNLNTNRPWDKKWKWRVLFYGVVWVMTVTRMSFFKFISLFIQKYLNESQIVKDLVQIVGNVLPFRRWVSSRISERERFLWVLLLAVKITRVHNILYTSSQLQRVKRCKRNCWL